MMTRFQAFLPQEWHKMTTAILHRKYLSDDGSQGSISAILSEDFHREKINVVNYSPISLMYFHGKNNTWVK